MFKSNYMNNGSYRGDNNTFFSHRTANGRRMKKIIYSLMDGEETVPGGGGSYRGDNNTGHCSGGGGLKTY